MELKAVAMQIPEGCNVILGQTHFIKTVEDLHEIMVSISSQVKFGIAFCEASGPCLVRSTGSDRPWCWSQFYHFTQRRLSYQFSQCD
ncbi:hypothetical protein NIES22_03670 [Calothrix brevissima NIES-22]|nr:hypothetical protein NIES22_03670 [Calothrix brevissima NIES-22]